MMVMPRSFSRSMESSTCSLISRSERPPQREMMRSASVDLPWSMCAMMEKLRMWFIRSDRHTFDGRHTRKATSAKDIKKGASAADAPVTNNQWQLR